MNEDGLVMTFVLIQLVACWIFSHLGENLPAGNGGSIYDDPRLIDTEGVVTSMWGFCSVVLGVFFKLYDLNQNDLDHFFGGMGMLGQGVAPPWCYGKIVARIANF
jgi:hypothetical protein